MAPTQNGGGESSQEGMGPTLGPSLANFPVEGVRKEDFPATFKDYHPDTFTHRHRLVVLLKATGLTNKQIAQELGYTENRVSVIVNDPRAPAVMESHAQEVADSLEDVRLRLKLYAQEALTEVVDEMRYCEDARVRQRAAFGILDRAGYSKIEKKFVASAQVDAEAGSEIAEALRESSMSDEALEADYTIEPAPEEGPDA